MTSVLVIVSADKIYKWMHVSVRPSFKNKLALGDPESLFLPEYFCGSVACKCFFFNQPLLNVAIMQREGNVCDITYTEIAALILCWNRTQNDYFQN